MSSNGKQLAEALERAKQDLRRRGDNPALDLEPVLRAALAQAGLTWELVEHRLDRNVDPPTLHAKFKLAHGASGQEQTREFPIPLGTVEPTETTLRNALSYLWTHSLRDVLHTPGQHASGPASHLNPTLKIPKIPSE